MAKSPHSLVSQHSKYKSVKGTLQLVKELFKCQNCQRGTRSMVLAPFHYIYDGCTL